MSDYNSSLPIRTESAGDAIVKVADATTPSQQLKVEADGSLNVNASFSPGTEVKITDGTETVNVNASNELQVRDDDANTLLGTIDADTSNLDVALSTRASESTLSTLNAKFVSGTDIGDVTINNAAGASAVNIQDGGNSITVDGSVTVSATDLDIRDLVFATDKVDASGSTVALDAPTLAALENITVSATNLDIRDLTHVSDSTKVGDGTDFLAINTDGSINVRLSDRSGTEQDSYDTSSAIAAAASDNHDYTTTGAFRLTSVSASASGKAKMEVQIETASGSNTFNTKNVQFNSTANPNMSWELSSPILVPSGARVRIIRTNKDNQAQDVYSTILGYNE